MEGINNFSQNKRIAFISTRIAGTDGVSLEIAKWARVLEKMGLECFYIAGQCDRPPERSAIIDRVHFTHPEVRDIYDRAFKSEIRTKALTDDILRMSWRIRDQIIKALDRFDVDGIIVENALTIPMNVPLGMALVQVVLEQGIPCLAHHHDFYWERERFLVSSIDDIIHYAFPPHLQQIQHVAINTLAAEEFSRRTGISCHIIPNVMDFSTPPPEPDAYVQRFRSEIGLGEDDLLILQPTRVVARKGIEHSIELARRLDPGRAKLVLTHASADEGGSYERRVREFADFLDVEVIAAEERIAPERGTDAAGRPLFTIEDAYLASDLVAYPSAYEGFGNTFLEAVYYRKPVVCNRYAIYRTDIEPCGFRPILFDGFLTEDTISEVRDVLEDDTRRNEMVEHNFRIGSKFFGLQVVERELRSIMYDPHSVYRLQCRRRKTLGIDRDDDVT